MKAEEAKKLADQALSQLSDALKSGRSQELTRYLAMMARFHRYSFGNILLIMTQKPESTHVAGFNAWKELGRFVKKGEKGIAIVAPMMIRRKEEEARTIDPGEKPSQPILRFRGVHVFDVSQTEGEALPEPSRVRGEPSEHLDRLKAVVMERGIVLDCDDLPGSAEGVSRGGRISIRSGLTPAQEFSVLVHEFAHELMHHGEDRPQNKTARETEAEAVAFVVCQSIGLDAGAAARDYIQLYRGDEKTLAESLDRIQKTAAAIITALGASSPAADETQCG